MAIVTGHEANREQSRMNWDALAGMDTLVFLMSVSTVRRVAKELIDRGRPADTPAAMIQMAFWHNERVVTATLATIAEEIDRQGISPPATLVIGEVVRLREKLKHAASGPGAAPGRQLAIPAGAGAGSVTAPGDRRAGGESARVRIGRCRCSIGWRSGRR